MDRLLPRPAFASLAGLPPGLPGSRLLVHERTDLGVARVMARKGQSAALRARIRELYGVDVPDGPRWAGNAKMMFAGAGPGAWLGIVEGAPADWPAALARDLSDAASVFDQSGAYGWLRLEGPAAAEVMAAGAFLDFHPEVFTVGSVAVTRLAQLDAIVMKHAAETFDVAVFRSFSNDFMRFVEQTGVAWGAPPARGF